MTLSGTITATMRWVDANGNPTTDPPPPEEVYVIQYANAWWTYSVEDGAVTVTQHGASNGLGTPYNRRSTPTGETGESLGQRIIQANGASGTIVLPMTLSAMLALTCTAGFNGNAWAFVNYSIRETAPADDYHFANYPPPPPAGTTPYAQTAADYQDGPLADINHTGYYVAGRVYTNQTAQHALTQLRETAVFFVFGHGGDVGKECQTFWDGTNWHYMVQKEGARNALMGPPYNVPANRIVWLDDPAIPNDAFAKVLLAVFEGCWTGHSSYTWGSPVDGVFAKGADCALGFTNTIYSHDLNPDGSVKTPGAEEWAERFWQKLAQGQTVDSAASNACTQSPSIPPAKGLGYRKRVGNGGLTIHPARYGQ